MGNGDVQGAKYKLDGLDHTVTIRINNKYTITIKTT